ncbi:MAG: endo-1,4-beta-xylanase [Geminicoccaceae bacterium]
MRVGFLAAAALVLVACDQVTIAEPEASWTGSIGRLVADGEDPENLEIAHADGTGAEHGRLTRVPVEDADVDVAVRLETLGQPPRMESLQARLVTRADMEADDACWLRFDARAVQPQVELGLGRLSIIVRPTEAGLEPLVHRSIYLEPVWTPIDLAFTVPSGLGAGEAEVVFGFGTQLQVVDVGGVSMRCFQDETVLDRLPRSRFSYAGREPDAAWRATAEKQIERYRKGDLAIEVTDGSGQPVADAEIHIQMSRHAFTFGTAVDADRLAGTDDEAATTAYRKTLGELFNTVSIDDRLRWNVWADEAERQTTEEALAWVRSIGLDLRGRGLVPTDSADLPDALQEKRDDPEAIRQAVREGVEATAGSLEERIGAWEVVDRPRERHDLLDLLGWDELGTWFELARSAAPEARLVLNESDILSGDRMAELATLLGGLIGENVPIDHIGVQGHFGAQPPPIQVLSDRFDQLASFDLPLVVTAFDMTTNDRDLHQEFTRDFLTLAFSHPSVEGFVFARFWDDGETRTDSAMYRSDGTITPIGKVYRDLVLRTWWTDIVAASNAEGELSSRVFQGDYMISARKDDQSAAATLRLGPEGAKVTLTLAVSDEDERAL